MLKVPELQEETAVHVALADQVAGPDDALDPTYMKTKIENKK